MSPSITLSLIAVSPTVQGLTPGGGGHKKGEMKERGRDGEGGRREGGGVVVMVECGDWEGPARGVRLAGKERGPNGN